MSIKASIQLFVQKLIQDINKETIHALDYWFFLQWRIPQ